MSAFFNRFLPDNAKEKECVFQCNEPRGNVAISMAIMAAGFILAPTLVHMIDGAIPFTGDAFLQAMFLEISTALNYNTSIPLINHVIYFMFALLAGMMAIKPSRSIAIAPAFAGILYIAFFFLAYFILAVPVDMDVLASGFIYWLVIFTLVMMLPNVLGSLASVALFSFKKCFVMGKGSVLKK